jgi:hypothetical protein
LIGSAAGPIGHPYVLPAAGARDPDGGYLLVIAWFGPEPGEQVVTLSRSSDGRDWEIGKEPLFTDLGMDLANPGPIPGELLRLDDGTWAMYGWAAHAVREGAFTSWRATAPEPGGPWTLDGEEILGLGPTGAWDSQAATIGAVQQTDDGFLAWFEGQPPGRNLRGDIGLATSTDGRTWRKFDDATTTDGAFTESDPVIARGICGEGSAAAVFQPQVERIDDGYVMVFGGFRPEREEMDLFGAVSDDGLTWRCAGETPLLRFEDIPGSEGLHSIASMPFEDGSIGILIESLRDNRSEVWLATVEPVD